MFRSSSFLATPYIDYEVEVRRKEGEIDRLIDLLRDR